MFRYLLISGGSFRLSPLFTDRGERDRAASAAMLDLTVNSGLPDDAVLLLDNAPESLVVAEAEYPTSEDIRSGRMANSTR